MPAFKIVFSIVLIFIVGIAARSQTLNPVLKRNNNILNQQTPLITESAEQMDGVLIDKNTTTFTGVAGKARAAIPAIDEGHFEGGRFVTGRRLNGDESHPGRHLRIPDGQYEIQKLTLYSYE